MKRLQQRVAKLEAAHAAAEDPNELVEVGLSMEASRALMEAAFGPDAANDPALQEKFLRPRFVPRSKLGELSKEATRALAEAMRGMPGREDEQRQP